MRMDPWLALSNLWARLGGLNGVIILTLLTVVVFLFVQVMKMNSRQMEIMGKQLETDNRLIDFKKAAWKSGLLNDRRHRVRKEEEEFMNE